LQRLHDMRIWELLALLRGRQKEIPDEMLNEVFLPLQVGFERMPPALRRKFMRLGAMDRFYSIDNQTLAALWEGSIVETSKLIVPELQNFISPFQAAGAGNWRLHEQTHLFAMSKFGELNLEEQDTALNWTKRLEGVCECSDLSSKKALETNRTMGTKINHPSQTRADQFRSFYGVFSRVFRPIVGNHNYYWEIIQKELAHISSYEYFICKKLQQQETKYLKNIRIGLLGIVALPVLKILTNVIPGKLTSTAYVTAFFACTIYTIKLYRVDLAGLWKCETQCQLIWDSISSRIMGGD